MELDVKNARPILPSAIISLVVTWKPLKYLPATIEELKNTIHQNLAEIPPETILRVMRIYRNLLQQFLANRCHDLEDVLFKIKLVKTVYLCVNNSEIHFLIVVTFFFLVSFKLLEVILPRPV